MKQLRSLVLLFVCILAANLLHAQDLMYLRGQKEPIKVKVIELGLEEIKYKYWPVNEDAPVQVIDKTNVAKVVLQSGDVYTFSANPMNNAFNYVGQSTCALKFNFFSPLCNHLGFSFEKSLKPAHSVELGLGIIGPGVQALPEASPQGVFFRGGYKFITAPDFYLRGMKYAHLLKGGYIKPELIFATYGISRPRPGGMSGDLYRRSVQAGALMINFGKQWVTDDVVCFDLYFGMGYAFTNYSKVNGYYNTGEGGPEIYHYAFLGGWEPFPIAFTAGFKVGFLFNKAKASNVMPSENSVK